MALKLLATVTCLRNPGPRDAQLSATARVRREGENPGKPDGRHTPPAVMLALQLFGRAGTCIGRCPMGVLARAEGVHKRPVCNVGGPGSSLPSLHFPFMLHMHPTHATGDALAVADVSCGHGSSSRLPSCCIQL